MASVSVGLPARRDWAPGRPWPWVAAGLALCGWAAAWAWVFGDRASDLRVVPLLLGLVAVGSAVAIRLQSGSRPTLDGLSAGHRRLVLLGLAAVYGLFALGLTALFVLAVAEKVPYRPAGTAVAWLLFAPVSVSAVRQALKRAQQADPGIPAESAATLLLASLAAALGSFALAVAPDDWDTVRMFVRVLAFAALVGGALALTCERARRVAVSVMLVVHFGGICTAALAAPPSPWLMNQLWIRVYRPYLEFMYLNNAYHFYAPEPGPARYLWFRVIYTAPDGAEHGLWYTVPKMDDKGRPQHPVALEYQRYLALTEGTAPTDQSPPTTVIDENGQLKPADYYVRRLNHMPGPIVVGQNQPSLVVPLHPYVPHLQQYQFPAASTKLLLSSYSRHVARKFEAHPDHPDWTLKGVKVYRADHMMVPWPMFARGMDPRDPETFRPFYMGMFDADGKLMDPDDPFLYWLLPVARFPRANQPNAPVENYARLHAGDRHWVCPVDPNGKAQIGTWIDPRADGGPLPGNPQP